METNSLTDLAVIAVKQGLPLSEAADRYELPMDVIKRAIERRAEHDLKCWRVLGAKLETEPQR